MEEEAVEDKEEQEISELLVNIEEGKIGGEGV
jgi:hypothetical protein